MNILKTNINSQSRRRMNIYCMASSENIQNRPNPQCTEICYPSEQDGVILPARDFELYPARQQFKMTGYWPGSLLRFYRPRRDSVSLHKHTKKQLGQYKAILTSRLINNPFILHFFRYLNNNKIKELSLMSLKNLPELQRL